jgi:hypothetical protein
MDVHFNKHKPMLKGDRIQDRRGLLEQTTDILEAVGARKAGEIPISREVGDSVLYHSQLGLASGEWFWGRSPEVATNRQSGFVNTVPLWRAYLQRVA